MLKIIDAELTDFIGQEYICVTTNGTVKKNGLLNMGKGNAKEVASVIPWVAEKLGQLVLAGGNKVYYAGEKIFSFPVEDTWLSQASITIVEKSAQELIALIDEMDIEKIYLPMPGCGKGGLSEAQVLKVIEPILDERVVLIRRSRCSLA